MKNKKALIPFALAFIAVILVLFWFFASDKKDDAPESISDSQEYIQQTSIEEASNGELVGYQINLGSDRSSPCGGMTYNLIYSKTGRNPIVLPVAQFTSMAAQPGSNAAQTIARNLSDDYKVIHEQYKFGEITSAQKAEMKDALVARAKADIEKLKLEEWNKELDKVKEDHNSKIVNGSIETCFSLYRLSKLTLEDYLDLKTLN